MSTFTRKIRKIFTLLMFYNRKILLLKLGKLFILGKSCCENLKMVEKNVEAFIIHRKGRVDVRKASGNFHRAKDLYPLTTSRNLFSLKTCLIMTKMEVASVP